MCIYIYIYTYLWSGRALGARDNAPGGLLSGALQFSICINILHYIV